MTVQDLENLDVLLGQNGFEPTFYWTGDVVRDAELINRPHIKAEGEQEDRIRETIDIVSLFRDHPDFDGIITIKDVFNIQNWFLKQNNYKGIRPGLRDHNIMFEGTPDWKNVPERFYRMFPVKFSTDGDLLLWYRVMMKIHPLSDLNGRTFGTIVSILYKKPKSGFIGAEVTN